MAVYMVVPKRIRYMVLLAASYYFYMSWNPEYALLIAASTVVTYACSLLMYRDKDDPEKKKIYLILNCVINLGILFVFKYYSFFAGNLNILLKSAGIQTIPRRFDLLLPVGISFYTFQALSYTFDVYGNKLEPERNLLKYALYVSFFPQLVAGPIERSVNLLPQVQNADRIRVWDPERIRDGLLLMLWGYFQKLVIADRAALLVDQVISNYTSYGFFEIFTAMILFAVQILCDFSGYTDIARGAAKVMGFKLMKNFRQPYLARDIRSFWRRWHISLTSWFTDYLYIPLGGNRKGEFRKTVNTVIVFAVSGLWHGAGWNYIIWGLLHALYMIAADIRQKLYGRWGWTGKPENFSTRIRKIICTFLLADFAWIFFVCNDLEHALGVIRQMTVCFQTTDMLQLLGHPDWFLLNAGIITLAAADILHEKNISVIEQVNRQELWFRLAFGLSLFWIIVMFGIYGPAYDAGAFIYFQF